MIGPRLLPDVSTPLGKEVMRIRQLLETVQYNAMSYGVWMYPELSPKGVRDLPVLKPEGTIQCHELWSLDVSGAVT